MVGTENVPRKSQIRRRPGTQEKLAEKIEEYRNTTANPIIDASFNVNVHDVVEPVETRSYLIRAFEMLEGKKKETPRKRHGNIPL
ncbi:MAG: hypothetical protein HY787_03170 [Deltaproteobacteria bacterium]|nr:hypothetical protein [Deltaproteobacteria bacterium]